MGSKGSKHTHTVERIIQDPKLQQEIIEIKKKNEDLNQEILTAKAEAKKMHDPNHFKTVKQEVWKKFLNRITELNFQDIIKRNDPEEVHCAVVGPISSGKSSLLNVMFGLQLPIGLGKTTAEAKLVFPEQFNDPNQKYFVWDAPGNERDWEFTDPETMFFFHSLDYCFLLYSSDPDDPEVRDMAELIYAVHPKGLRLIRTKADQADSFTNQKQKPVDQVIEEDKKKVKEMLGADIPIFAISSKNVENKTGSVFDWKELENAFKNAKRNPAPNKKNNDNNNNNNNNNIK